LPRCSCKHSIRPAPCFTVCLLFLLSAQSEWSWRHYQR